MNRRGIFLGVITSLIVPVALISCNNNQTNKIESKKEQKIKATEIVKAKKIYQDQTLKKLVESVKNKQDGLFLVKNYYHGSFYNPSKQFTHGTEKHKISSNLWERIPLNTGGWGRKQNVVEISKGDSLLMIYNDNDNDGFSQTHFTNNVSFEDSSLPWPDSNKEILELNKKFGAIKFVNKWSYNIGFIESKDNPRIGYLGQYLLSQTNHGLKFKEAIDKLKNQLTTDQFQLVENYYKKASKAFVPQLIDNKFIKYEKLGDKVVKITFIGDKKITAAHFTLTPFNDFSKKKNYGTYSIHKDDWQAYETSRMKYFFMGRHINENSQ